MEGNTFPELDYAIRITFGIIHGVILTLSSLGICLYLPTLMGYVVAPLISLLLTIFCTASVEYMSHQTMTLQTILSTAWIPPVGIFCATLILHPTGNVQGPYGSAIAISIVVNFILSILLQVYAAKGVQASKSSGLSDPI